MKKYLLSALALPLLFACSSEDILDQKPTDNDQFAGIEKVDATFSMAEETMRMATKWGFEYGDVYGFAWLGDGTIIKPDDTTNGGKAFQNHPLIQTREDDGETVFKPQTSIYVGKYYLYAPYDDETVDIEEIKFNSLKNQPLAEGYESTTDAWKALAKSSINIGDKWTTVTTTGTDVDGDGTMWNIAGRNNNFKIYGAVFSNQTGLDLTYSKNNPTFGAATAISGATDINYTIAKGDEVGAAAIYDGTVQLTGAANSFTYAPTTEPNTGTHSGTYWADKKKLGTTEGFTFNTGAITLKPADEENGILTGAEGNKGWFWFNSLPVTDGTATNATNVVTNLTTSYGVVKITKSIKDCAYAFEQYTAGTGSKEWIKLSDAASTSAPKAWNFAAQETFINHYGNHKGKYALTVDFSKGTMNGMHIKNDAHLQKALKYYLASGKTETGVVLNLDGASAADKTFKLSKISIALLQTINASSTKVTVQPCGSHNNPVKVIITQEGQADLGLGDKTEVPNLNKVFATITDVYLGSGYTWTWKERTAPATNQLTIDANVSSITNEGTLTVNATNIQLSETTATLANAKDATMNITQVTTVKNALTNLGTINVGSATNTAAELRAYGVNIVNDATSLEAYGVINNYGVIGVSEGTVGKVNNYGLIDMKNSAAITLLTTNEVTTDFDNHFDATNNKMGTVKLPDGNPTAIVSVNNADANGFIEYTWPAGTSTYVTPAGNVKYNTIVVSGDIEFNMIETEIQYIRFDGTRTQVVNPGGLLTKLKGIIVNPGKSIIIEKGNKLVPSKGTYLGAGATVYNGGTFTHNATVSGTTASNYFGDWSTDQIVKY